MLPIDQTVENFPKITKPQVAALKKLGIQTVQDLLLYFPYRYIDFSKTAKISEIKPGENITIKGTIKTISSRFSFHGRMSLAEAIISDDTGSLKVVWFNQGYLAKTLNKGEEIFLAGAPDYYKQTLQLTNPIYEKVSDPLRFREGEASFPVHTARLVPVYHLKSGIYPRTLRNLIASILPQAKDLTESLPQTIIENQNLPSLVQTINFSHFPETLDQVELAKKRLAFEEIFLSQLAAKQHKLKLEQKKSYKIKFDQKLIKTFLATLPFALTSDQKKAAWEILQDLEKPVAMNRLLEGDVGSGKTLVALMAAVQSVSEGYQAILLAPTEILAQQHYNTAHKMFCDTPLNFNTRCALLTRNFCLLNNKETKPDRLAKLIAEGMPGIYIGTHALLEKKIKFKKLALVIIDEQHRFGVEQRAALFENTKKIPHLLSLSATPIPRTLQLAFFGELDISRIKNKPLGRKPITTKLVNAVNRPKAYDFIKKQVLSRRQAFVITPLIEESDTLGVKAAKTEIENLKKIFPEFKIGLMHGRLKGVEKENVMKDFLENKIQILVSTSVVEVGVDVPNASVMVIEGADRFGLSQLHQFRGRVGRAEHQSYCLLFSDNQNPETLERLESFTKTQDGFELAELDLKQRGFGEVYGITQSGWNFKYFNPSYTALIQPARQEALAILKNDLDLNTYPLLKEKIKDKVIHFE